jgi:uncharacterized protein Yka (UPF0111/DUF47 family)
MVVAFNFLPRDEHYFVLFEESAQNVTEGAKTLLDLVIDLTDMEAKANRLRAIEEAGDEITFRVIARLSKSFITPIEREDILAIARHLDDVIDWTEAVGARVASYGIEASTEAAIQFARLILQAAEETERLLALLHKKNVDQIRQPKRAINRVEAEADQLLRRSLVHLFTGGFDALTVIKWKEIYETFEEVTDRQEALANLVEGIILKNT